MPNGSQNLSPRIQQLLQQPNPTRAQRALQGFAQYILQGNTLPQRYLVGIQQFAPDFYDDFLQMNTGAGAQQAPPVPTFAQNLQTLTPQRVPQAQAQMGMQPPDAFVGALGPQTGAPLPAGTLSGLGGAPFAQSRRQQPGFTGDPFADVMGSPSQPQRGGVHPRIRALQQQLGMLSPGQSQGSTSRNNNMYPPAV
jgi:hypothetical protein